MEATQHISLGIDMIGLLEAHQLLVAMAVGVVAVHQLGPVHTSHKPAGAGVPDSELLPGKQGPVKTKGVMLE